MEYSNETPRVSRTIAGIEVQVIAPYAAGHVVTDGEAAMLNQTLAENFSNNLRTKLEKFVPEGSPEGTEPRAATAEEAQAIVDQYAGVYQPGVRRTGSGGGAVRLDPIEKEMKAIATQKLSDLLREKKLTRKQVKFDELLQTLLTNNADALRAAATKIVKARNQNTGGDLDLSAVDFGAAAAPSEA
jgi:hypothetical protein